MNGELFKLKSSTTCVIAGLTVESDYYCKTNGFPLGGPVVRTDHYVLLSGRRMPVRSVTELLKIVCKKVGSTASEIATSNVSSMAVAIASIDELGSVSDFDDPHDPFVAEWPSQDKIVKLRPAFDGRHLRFGVVRVEIAYFKSYWDIYEFDVTTNELSRISAQEM